MRAITVNTGSSTPISSMHCSSMTRRGNLFHFKAFDGACTAMHLSPCNLTISHPHDIASAHARRDETLKHCRRDASGDTLVTSCTTNCPAEIS
jgi:hypothetical protein